MAQSLPEFEFSPYCAAALQRWKDRAAMLGNDRNWAETVAGSQTPRRGLQDPQLDIDDLVAQVESTREVRDSFGAVIISGDGALVSHLSNE